MRAVRIFQLIECAKTHLKYSLKSDNFFLFFSETKCFILHCFQTLIHIKLISVESAMSFLEYIKDVLNCHFVSFERWKIVMYHSIWVGSLMNTRGCSCLCLIYFTNMGRFRLILWYGFYVQFLSDTFHFGYDVKHSELH